MYSEFNKMFQQTFNKAYVEQIYDRNLKDVFRIQSNVTANFLRGTW